MTPTELDAAILAGALTAEESLNLIARTLPDVQAQTLVGAAILIAALRAQTACQSGIGLELSSTFNPSLLS